MLPGELSSPKTLQRFAIMDVSYNLEGNAFFIAAYGALLLPQIYFGIRHRTWGFLFGMFAGGLLEVIGYVARVQMHFGQKKFLMWVQVLTQARLPPADMAATGTL